MHFRFSCVQHPLSFIALGFELKGKQPIFLVLCIFKILKITPMDSIRITIIISVWWGEVVCMCVWEGQPAPCLPVEVTGKFMGVRIFLLPCGSVGLNSGCRSWQQVPLSVEPFGYLGPEIS